TVGVHIWPAGCIRHPWLATGRIGRLPTGIPALVGRIRARRRWRIFKRAGLFRLGHAPDDDANTHPSLAVATLCPSNTSTPQVSFAAAADSGGNRTTSGS